MLRINVFTYLPSHTFIVFVHMVARSGFVDQLEASSFVWLWTARKLQRLLCANTKASLSLALHSIPYIRKSAILRYKNGDTDQHNIRWKRHIRWTTKNRSFDIVNDMAVHFNGTRAKARSVLNAEFCLYFVHNIVIALFPFWVCLQVWCNPTGHDFRTTDTLNRTG